MKEFWNYVFLASYTKEEAGVGVESGLRGRLTNGASCSPVVPCTLTATTKIAWRENGDGELGGGFKYCLFSPHLGRWSNLTNIFQRGWKPPTREPFWWASIFLFQVGRGQFFLGWLTGGDFLQNLIILTNVMLSGVAHHMHFFHMCIEYVLSILYTGNLHARYIHIYAAAIWVFVKVGLLYGFFLCLMSTRLDQPSPCCPTWTLWHPGSWIRFTKEVCPTSNMVTKEISSTLGWKGRSFSGELWIGSPFKMTDEGYVYIYIIYILYNIYRITFVSEEWGANLFVWRMFVVKWVQTNRIPGVQVAIGNIKRSKRLLQVLITFYANWYRQTFFWSTVSLCIHFSSINLYIERVHIMDMYAYTFAIDTRYFCCGQSRSVLGFRLVPLPQIVAEFCPTGMTQILALFTENPCMFMVFISKKMCNFHDFLGQVTLEHVQNCWFSIFSKPWQQALAVFTTVFRTAPLCILPSRQPSNQPNSTAKQVCKNIISWIGGKNPTRSFSVPEQHDIAWRYHESHSCIFGGCGSTCHKKTCEGCWKWESTFSNLVSNILCAGCMVMFGELWFPQSFRAIWMIHRI